MKGEVLPSKIESYFSAMKAPVMEVKWPVCSSLENLNGWLYIAVLSASADRQAQERNALKNKCEWKSVCVCLSGRRSVDQ